MDLWETRGFEMSGMTYVEFYREMGFLNNPFILHSAEAEAQAHDQERLFIKPMQFGPVYAIYQAGTSIFLIGDRGVGKTALAYDFARTATSNGGLCVIVDNFASIKLDSKLEYNTVELYHLIAEGMVAKIFQELTNSSSFAKFDNNERVFLSYLRQQFLRPVSRGLLDKDTEMIQFPPWKRRVLRFWQWIRFPLNFLATVASNLVVHTLSKSIGPDVPDVNTSEVRKIFPDLPFKTDNSYYNVQCNLNLIRKICDIIEKLGKSRTTIIIDKLDEDRRLRGDLGKAASFLQPLVTDHDLLLGVASLQIVVCLWAVAFRILEQRGIRPQKINTERLSWDRHDLENALDTRIRYYSSGNLTDWRALFETEVGEGSLDEMFFVANGNPRHLWQMIDKIFREQYKSRDYCPKITQRSLEKGLAEFVSTYRYYEDYPRNSGGTGKRPDVYTCIQELLKLENSRFTREELSEQAKIRKGLADFHIQEMETMGLVLPDGASDGQTIYRIADPKVEFSQWNNLEPVRVLY